ncbi:hypothetical protein [Cupriavidus sp. CuC1]|uniref:hypothetical protein n=1 Tax=Cupriavidus sp. CuC1 TaxID=3373131 RepID=UPI0037D51FC0
MRKSIDGLSYLVEPLLAKNPLLCGETKYVATNRKHAARRLIVWPSSLRPATHKSYSLSSRLRTASFG